MKGEVVAANMQHDVLVEEIYLMEGVLSRAMSLRDRITGVENTGNEQYTVHANRSLCWTLEHGHKQLSVLRSNLHEVLWEIEGLLFKEVTK